MSSIHLQGIGRVKAKPAQEFRVGDYMGWDYGGVSKVVGIAKETAKTITFLVLCSDGQVYERRMKKTRLVAVAAR